MKLLVLSILLNYYYYCHKLFYYHGYNLLQKGLKHQLIYLAKIVYQTLCNSWLQSVAKRLEAPTYLFGQNCLSDIV